MTSINITLAQTYYTAMANKDLVSLASCLHADIVLISPLATIRDKSSVVESAHHFMSFFNSIEILESFGEGEKAVLILDFNCPDPVGAFRAASFITIEDSLISRIELFYDARPFEKKQDEIFVQK